MSTTRYACGTERRRELVAAHATLNGIDHVHVLDSEYAAIGQAALRQRTLLVRCLKTVPGAAAREQVRIRGGVRIVDPAIEWAWRADKTQDLLNENLISAAEKVLLDGVPHPTHVLVVRTREAGDFSPYMLELVQSQADPAPLAGFDPCLTTVRLYFRVECPADFDCKVAPTDAPPRRERIEIDYLARDFASLRRLILDRLSVTMPTWRETSLVDIGHTLVDAFAHVGDYLSYRQDAVGTEAYLGTARSRVSLRRHARLLDYRMHEGCNARAFVVLDVAKGGGADGLVLHAGTKFLTRSSSKEIGRTAQQAEEAAREGAQVFESLHDLTLHGVAEPISLYAWGEDTQVLPIGTTMAGIENRGGALAALAKGDVLVFEEARDPETGVEADANPAHRHAVRLTDVALKTDPLSGEDIAHVCWSAADALPFCLTAGRIDVAGEPVPQPVTRVHRNVVLVDQGRTVILVAADDLGLPPVPPWPHRYRPELPHVAITHSNPYAHQDAQVHPDRHGAGAALRQDARTAMPVITVDDGRNTWEPVLDLLASDRFQHEFVLEIDERDGQPGYRTAMLRFGDGVAGRRPLSGTTFGATYRVGNGAQGNVGADAIAHVVAPAAVTSGIQAVRNPMPAEGGTDPEAAGDVRRYAPYAFRRQERAITEADYAAVAERHRGIQKAVATRRWTGSWTTIFVTVDRKGGRPVDAAFEDELRAHMERFRLAGHDIEIDAPRYVALEIAMTVCVDAGALASDVTAALLVAFSAHDLPGGGRGFFHPDRFTFGQPVHLSDVIAGAMGVPGVRWVDLDEETEGRRNRFGRYGQPSRDEHANGYIDMGRLEIARLENDPSAPEHGIITFDVTGGRG